MHKSKILFGASVILFIISMMGIISIQIVPSSELKKLDVQEQSIDYFKDARTNLCYAATGVQTKSKWRTYLGLETTTGLGIAHVECTPEVERLIYEY